MHQFFCVLMKSHLDNIRHYKKLKMSLAILKDHYYRIVSVLMMMISNSIVKLKSLTFLKRPLLKVILHFFYDINFSSKKAGGLGN